MVNLILSIIAAAGSLGLAIFVLVKDRRSLVHWTFAGGMALLGAEVVLAGLAYNAQSLEGLSLWLPLRFMVTALIPGAWLFFSLTFSRANYREFVDRWKWGILAIFVLPVVMTVLYGGAFLVGPPVMVDSTWLLRLGWSGYIFHIVLLVGSVLIIANIEKTLRTSTGHMRWQTKFLLFGVGSVFGIRIYTASQAVLFRAINTDLDMVGTVILIVAELLIAKSLLRSKMLNVDFYLSESAIYSSLTILVVGVYFIGVGIIAKIAVHFKVSQGAAVEAMLTFLGILGACVLLLSDRLRKKMKRFINRNFQRPLYDYRKEWGNFAKVTTSVAQINDLCPVVAKMISTTLEVLAVSIWVMDERKDQLTLGGSTALPEKLAAGVEKQMTGLLRVITREQLPLDFVYSKEHIARFPDWPDQEFFKTLKIDYCLPLASGEQMLGLITIGGKVGAEAFTLEDFELLKTIADQTAASLLSLTMSERLREARELEAYRNMSAFFIHDLKNVGSKLSLTMQNLPIHFDNPEFREDALRSIAASLTKINTMCNRLSSLSQKLEITPEPCDLNGIIKGCLTGLNGSLSVQVGQDLDSLPQVMADSEQIQKVFTNLVLNAHEAMNSGGEILIATRKSKDWVEVSVTDNGCGMPREYIEKSLFQPFRTTKKQGMGIGLYQSKMIVEAHKGKMEVESEEGKGTTFRVLLPLK